MDDEDFAELFRNPRRPTTGNSWEDVANEFKALGRTLGDAARAAWERHDDGELGELRAALNSMIADVNRTIGESVATPEGQHAREQLSRLTESIRQATARASEELRPELLRLLRQANAELRRMTDSAE
jgi:hypothetical protein